MSRATSLKKSSKGSKENLSKVAESIISSITFKKFPEEYTNNLKIEKTVDINELGDIKHGKDVSGFFVSSDKEKLYFEDEYTAKYVYYCEKLGKTHIIIPDKKEINIILTKFEEDLEKLKDEINQKIKEFTEDEKYINKIYKICMNKLPILNIKK